MKTDLASASAELLAIGPDDYAEIHAPLAQLPAAAILHHPSFGAPEADPTPISQVTDPTPIIQVTDPTPIIQVTDPTPIIQVTDPTPISGVTDPAPVQTGSEVTDPTPIQTGGEMTASTSLSTGGVLTPIAGHIYVVSTAAQLTDAIAKAGAGDTIALAAGTYDSVSLSNIDKALTITSADPNAPAELTGLKLSGVSGLTISDVTMADKDASTLYDFSVLNSSNIHFDHVLIKGPDGDSGYTSAPLMIRDSQNVAISNSEITHVRYGISMLDNTGIELSGNYFHDIRTDGIRGGGNSDIAISGNYFTDFHPAEGDHPDAIQFWTTNETASAANISITDNVIMRGAGEAMQGIFMRDESNTLPYKNVVISDNLIVGGMYHGINVTNADGLTVTDNVVDGYTDQKSWISVNDVTVLEGNVAQLFIVDGVNQGSAPANNTEIAAVYDGGAALLANWLLAHPDAAASLQSSPVLGDSYVDLQQLASAPPPPVPVTTVNGTDGADQLKAAAFGDSILNGGLGNDVLTGGSGHTQMNGGAGDDVYNVHSAGDTVVELAGQGTDTVYTTIDYTLTDNVETLRLAASDLTVHGNLLDNRIVGSAGSDTMFGEGGNDSLQGLDGNDHLDGGAGSDSLSGGLGNDQLYGGDGNDSLFGNEGDDVLSGGAGDDLLEGGAGNDTMSGGAGKDLFQFRPADLGYHDVITDFSTAEGDRIGLSLIDANTGTAINDAFKFIGTASFGDHAGELRYSAVDGGVLVEGDVNGDGMADLSILLHGVSTVHAGDFVL